MTRKRLCTVLVVGCILAASYEALAAQTNDILSKIEILASPIENVDQSLGKSVADGIENNPGAVSRGLLPKLADKNLPEKQLAVYVWALGLTRDQYAVDPIMSLYRQNQSDLIQGNCLRALATIGGNQAGGFLLSALDAVSDRSERFNIIDLLGQMQYQPALPITEEILKRDPKEFYWQSIFVFGKMGDKAVPFLLERINDKDRNIRANVIHVLGQWLIPIEAAKTLQEHFSIEKDVELRGMTLSSLERTIIDLDLMHAVFKQIVATEKDEQLARFAGETLANMDRMKAEVLSYAKSKKVSGNDFTYQYSLLLRSFGKDGDYEILASASSAEDEPKLKALRERILQRGSDEAFYDYQKINNIIIRNRFADSMINRQTPNKPDAGDGN